MSVCEAMMHEMSSEASHGRCSTHCPTAKPITVGMVKVMSPKAMPRVRFFFSPSRSISRLARNMM